MDIRKLFSLEGRVALVTGATHGLGMAVATALAGAGATLAVNGHSADRLDKALKTYENKGIDAKGYLFDVTDEQAVATAMPRPCVAPVTSATRPSREKSFRISIASLF